MKDSNLSDGEKFTLTVTWGAEKFAPIQYHSFDMGPLAVTITSEPGLSMEEAHKRALGQLKQMAEVQFEEQLRGFTERAKQAATVVRAAR